MVDGADAAGCAFDLLSLEGLGAVGLVVGAVVLIGVLFLFGIPLLLAVVDVVLVILPVVGGAIARLLFRRPWTIEASSSTGDRIVRHAVGWRGSGEARDDLANEITHGRGQVGSPP